MNEVPGRIELELRLRELSARSPLWEAARLQLCLEALELDAKLDTALTAGTPGPLHDARVAGRRLRAGAPLFQRIYPGAWRRAEARARRVVRALREPRDLDIRCARLRRLMRRLSGCRAPLERRLQETTGARLSTGGPVAALGRAPLSSLLPELWRPRRASSPEAERFVSVRMRELSLSALHRIPMASVEGLGGVQHRLRIRGRALRYSMEMMQWRLGEEARWRVGVLRRGQDVLGELHDIDVFLEYLSPEKGLTSRGEEPCIRTARSVLEEERRRAFGRFLDLRGELEKACRPFS